MATATTRRTVRTSIVLKVTVVIGATMAALLIVLLAIGYIYGRRSIRTGVQNRIVGIAASRQALLRDTIAREEERIGLVADRPRLQQMTAALVAGGGSPDERAELDRFLDEIVAARQGFLTLSIVTREGRILQSSDAALAGQQLPAQTAIRRGWRDRFVDEPRQENSNHVAWVSAPVRDEQGRSIAVAVGQISVAPLVKSLTSTAGLGKSGEILLGKREGNEIKFLLPPRNANELKSVSPAKAPVLTAAIEGKILTTHINDYRGIPVLATGRPVGYDRWGLVVKIDAAEAYEALNDAWNAAAGFGVLIIACGLFAGYGVARSFSRPILQLASAAKNVTEGQLGTRVPVTSADELGDLARAFNNMTAQLAASYNRLETSNEELRRRDERLRRMVDTAELGINFCDDSGQIYEVNESWLRITGYSRDEVLHNAIGWKQLTAPEHVERDRLAVEQLKSTGRAEPYEKDYIRKDGTRVPVLVTVTRVAGPPDQQVAFVMDLSARKAAEAGRYAAEAKFRLLVEQSLVGTYIIHEHRFAYVNPKLGEILGRSPAELTSAPVTQFIAEEDRAAVAKYFQDVVRGEAGANALSVRALGRDRTVIHVEIHGGRTDYDGQPAILGTLLDVTERKRAEDAMRESERRFRELAETLPQLVWTCRPDGPCDYLSPQWIQYAGVPESQLLGSGWLEFIHPEDREPISKAWNAAVAAGGPFDVEARIRGADGQYRWFKHRATALRDAAGNVTKWFGTNTDIDEQRRVQEALRESESRRRAILESALDGVVVMSHEGRIVELNPAAETIFGRSAANLMGQRLDESIIPERLRESHRRGVAAYLATGEAKVLGRRIEMPALRADGSEFPVEMSILQIPQTDPPMFCGFLRDITERRKAEDALKRSEEQFRVTVEATPNGIVMVDSEGRITLVNTQTERLFGYTRAELVGQPVELLVPLHARGQHTTYRTEYSHGPSARAMGVGRDLFARRKDGTEFPVEIGLTPIPTASGTMVLASVTDITQRKHAEEALRESAEFNRQIVSSAREAVIVFDCERRCQVWNTFMEEVSGIASSRASGRKADELFPEEQAPEIAALLLRAAAGETVDSPAIRFRLPGVGRESWIAGRIGPLLDAHGDIVGIIATLQDITERRLAVQALRESEQRLRIVIDLVPHFIFAKDHDGRFIFANRAFADSYGMLPEELAGRLDKEVAPNREQFERFRQDDLEVIESGKPKFIPEESRISVTGETSIQQTSKIPFAVPGSGQPAVLGVAVDITERKRAEEQIKASLNEKEVLLKEIHHRVKNNMQVISSLLNLQSNLLEDPATRGALREMQDRVRAMALVHEKLYQTGNLARVDFVEYARSLLQYLVRGFTPTGTRVDLVIDAEPAEFVVDVAVPCGLLLNELATNSLKHGFRGRSNGRITLTLHNLPGDRVQLVFRDNGVGLPSGFDHRQSSTLGLRLVHMLAQQLGAKLEIDSGEGAEFRITFAQPPAA